MSSSARIGLVAAAVAVLVAAFVALSPGGDDEPTTAGTSSGATTTATSTTSSVPTTTSGTAPAPTTPAPPPSPTYATIRVRAGAPVGGVRTIRVEKGDTARIRVSSSDTSDELHLHGYDLYRDVAPGRPARFVFRATAEGIFEIELHHSGAQIGRLVVEP